MNRIREFRAAKGWSLQKLAEASSTSKSQIDKLEKGSRRLTVDWMVRLAKPLGCDPRELMPPQLLQAESALHGLTMSGNLIPVRGPDMRSGKKSEMILSDAPIDHVQRPYFLLHARDAYALYVPDQSMIPMYRLRQLLFINPYKPPTPGNGVVIIDKSGAVTIREFLQQKPSGIVVRVYHPLLREVTIPQTEIASLHAVAGAVEP